MGKQLVITENGKHNIGKKLFITDNNRVHKKGKKAFLTVGGVHRLVYSSGVKWEKWSCEIVAGRYEATEPNTQYMNEWLDSSIPLYDSYEISSESGYYGVGLNTFSINDDLTEAIGKYRVTDERVVEIESLTTNGHYFSYEGIKVGEITYFDPTYSKGTTLVATIEVEEGALPESGTLIEGSAEDGYCVLEIGGTYYYYVIN